MFFACLHVFLNNIIHQQISKHFAEERGHVNSALFSADGETEAQRNHPELQASLAVMPSHLGEASSQDPALVQATSQLVLINWCDFLPDVVCCSCCRGSAAVFAHMLHLRPGVCRAP